MTTVKEYIDKMGQLGPRVVGYAIIGSMINIMLESSDELEDEELSNQLDALLALVMSRQKEIMGSEVIE